MSAKCAGMETLQKDPLYGLDSRWSWIQVGFCCWTMFMSTMSVRASGVIFVGLIDFYNATREEASWPLTVHIATTSMGGIVFGCLSELWSINSILFGCSFLVSGGILLCYFAPNIGFITFLFGIVHGGALSAFFVLCNVIASQHFKKWRGTAVALTWSFQCLNVAFTPQLVECFRSEYGTPEMFLLLGALTMNVIPAAFAIRSPPWVSSGNRNPRTTPKDAEPSSKCAEEPLWDESRDSNGHQEVRQESRTVSYSHETSGMLTRCHPGTSLYTRLRVSVRPFFPRILQHAKMRAFFTLTFYLDAVSFGMLFYNLTTYLLIFADLAHDRGIDASMYVYLVGCHSVGDLTMRLLSGFVIDRGLVSVEVSHVISFLGSAFAFQLLVWSTSIAPILLSSLLLGAFVGQVVGLPALVILADFKDCCLSVTLGGLLFIQGLVLLPRPAMIGYFRDSLQSYDGLLHAFTCANTVFAFGWVLKIVLKRRRENSRTVQDSQNRGVVVTPLNTIPT